MARPSLVIYGVDGFGRQAAEIALQHAAFELAACISPPTRTQEIDALVADARSQLAPLRARGVTHALVAFEDNRKRMLLAHEIEQLGFELATLIHPSSMIARSAVLDRHVVIGPRATICVNAKIEAHAVINTSAIVEHDNRIGPGVWLAPAVRLAGGVKVEQAARLDLGACVIPGCTIGAWSTVAPGAVVIHSVPAATAVAGVPAEPISPPHASSFVPDQPTAAQAANAPSQEALTAAV